MDTISKHSPQLLEAARVGLAFMKEVKEIHGYGAPREQAMIEAAIARATSVDDKATQSDDTCACNGTGNHKALEASSSCTVQS